MFQTNAVSSGVGSVAWELQRGGYGLPSAAQSREDERSAHADRVELSDEARLLDSEQTLIERQDQRIAEIRQQIAEGRYLTDEKLEYAVDRLHDELFGK